MEQCGQPKEMSSTQGRDHAAIDDACGRPRAVKPAGRRPKPEFPTYDPLRAFETILSTPSSTSRSSIAST